MLKETNELGKHNQIDIIAATISKWTKESGTMLPKDPSVIKKLIESENSVTMMGYGREPYPIAFGAITFMWPNYWIELGAVVVDPMLRGKGYGTEIVSSLIKFAGNKYPGSKLFALCNQYSLNLFLKNGAQVITDPNMLPEEVWKECVACPMFNEAKRLGKLCCDTPVVVR